ncbi:RagB/SusD family nutrient uptake outer membrane protein [Tenacibaculum singaporense]|uniref:RagB/SusD family nutrient uptake outer membrane protein n=1 Tax=Tenacibaculum singaporense TaxID=2358479 RepID=A0A3Q8RSQ3_9FLAO|nr:RagB/SusD family nutrient uptake outer membrane protein [Tenacibaculum singaporense]AZJ36573.1 RagB/SusD family nutrient uptake outer membrane protein [Tenacibaculum singaporense]
MKKIKSYKIIMALSLGAITLMPSCSDILDIEPQQNLSNNVALSSSSDLVTAARGMYDLMQDEDYYGRSMFVLPAVMSDEMFISSNNAGRYSEMQNYTFNSRTQWGRELWKEAYESINAANEIIAANITDLTTAGRNAKGEAYAVRALSHFNLVNFFALQYPESSDLGIALKTNTDPTELPSRSSVEQVYQQVINDLIEAESILDDSNNSGRFTKTAVQALLAKVYLYSGDKVNAADYASKVISTKGSLSSNWKNDILLEIRNTDIDNEGVNSFAYFIDQRGYGDGLARESLFNLYDDNDTRKSDWYLKGDRTGGEIDTQIITKFTLGGATSPNDDNYPIIRLPEMYLIRAEATMTTNPAQALIDLNAVANARNANTYGAINLDNILLERQKELAFEGHRLFDLIRNGKDINRTTDCSVQCSLPYSSNKDSFVLPIPQVELDANPNMQPNPNQ